MATREIKTRFKLEGEQEYKRAMTDAASAVKVLNSEQKLAKAQYEATGDGQRYAAEQARILKEQIEAQKKAVKAAEDAVAELTKNGVTPNSKEMQTWRTRLNNAKTALVNMENQRDKVGTELSEEEKGLVDAQTAAGNFQGEMEKVAKGISLQNTIAAIDNVTDHIEAGVRKAAQFAKAIWEMGADAGKWADTIATEAAKLGVDAETYQSWQYASRFIDTSVNDIAKSWQDIDKKLAQEGDALYEYMGSLAEAGIQVRESTGAMRQGKDIFWDTIDYLHNIGDEGKRSAEAMRLFGNDWRNLNPLIEAGSKAYQDMAQTGREVAVVSNANVAALASVDDSMQDLQAQADKAKFDTIAELSTTLLTVNQALTEAVSAWDAFVQSDEGRAAFAELNEALRGVIGAFLGEDGGQGTFEHIVDMATGAVKGFTEAMEWIGEHGELVKDILVGLGIAWAGLTVTKEVLLFLQLLRAIPLDKLKAMFGGGTAGGAGTAMKTAQKAATTAGGGSVWGKIGSWLAGAADIAAPLAIGGAAVAGTVSMVNAYEEGFRQQAQEELDAIQQQARETAKAQGRELSEAMEAVDISKAALGISEVNRDIFGRGVLADPYEIREALDQIAAMDADSFLSPELRLRLRRQQTVGMDNQGTYDLMYDILQDAADSLGRDQARPTAASNRQDVSDALSAIQALHDTFADIDTWEGSEALRALIDDLKNSEGVFASLSDDTKDFFGEFLDPETRLSDFGTMGTQYGEELIDRIRADLEAAQEQYVDDGRKLPEGYARGIDENAGQAVEAAVDMAGDTSDATKGMQQAAYDDGRNTAIGLGNGIYDNAWYAINAGTYMAAGVEGAIRSYLQINSPARLPMQDGRYTAQGFALGMEQEKDRVDQAVERMTSATRRRPVMTIGGVQVEDGGYDRRDGSRTTRGADGSGKIEAIIVMDEVVVGRMVAPAVNDRIGAKIQSTRR